MNKFFVVFVTLCLIGQSQAGNLRVGFSGDLQPSRRHLSEDGLLNLKIDGRGYFQYRLRVKNGGEGDSDGSQIASTGSYGEAYGQVFVAGSAQVGTAAASCVYTAGNGATGAASTCVNPGTGTAGTCATAAAYNAAAFAAAGVADVAAELNSVGSGTAVATLNAAGAAACALLVATPGNSADFVAAGAATAAHVPTDNSDRGSGQADGGSEAASDGDADNFSQTIYSRDGSLHVNRYGYLVDDNGLLLVSDSSVAGSAIADGNAKFHIHIPSRGEEVLVTPSGKVLVEELGGSSFSNAGQIKLARFENPQGLNIRLKMKSNCAAANEDGFALGNWCAGGELDGKDHTYLSETLVSGPGIIGNPGDQGFGRISQ